MRDDAEGVALSKAERSDRIKALQRVERSWPSHSRY